MTNEEKMEVEEVKVVVEVLKEYLEENKDMPYEVVKKLADDLNKIRRDYDSTIKNLLSSSSLVVKLERLIEVIGMIGTISIEDSQKLEQTLIILENCVDSIKH